MSKAFLRESDTDDTPEMPRPAAVLPPGVRNLMTAGGAGRLRAELTRLIEQGRPPLAARIRDDAEARRELQVLDQRIQYLEASLASAEIVPPAEGRPEVVRFGHLVTVREPDGSVARYHLVGVDETDASPEAVSWQAPVARALLNARRGERVEFRAPGGKRELEILTIE